MLTRTDIHDSIELARRIRRAAVAMVHRARASHIGGALSAADLLAVLYSDILRYDPADPAWAERDRLLFSKGHACTALYAVLREAGFLRCDPIDEYAADGSLLLSHASHHVPGVELSTGSLGHALPVACGRALAAQRKSARWKTYVVLSDGELDEGSNWEAFLFAAHHRLDALTVCIDANAIQSLGRVEDVLRLEPLAEKLRAFGWGVAEVDGHDHDALRRTFRSTPFESGNPSAIIARTVKGKGVPFMENLLLWHYRSPDDRQAAEAMKSIDRLAGEQNTPDGARQ